MGGRTTFTYDDSTTGKSALGDIAIDQGMCIVVDCIAPGEIVVARVDTGRGVRREYGGSGSAITPRANNR